MVPAHQKHDGDPLKAQPPVKRSGTRGTRPPRNLIVLALTLVAVIVGVLVVINRDSGQSESGSATARVGTGPNKTLADYLRESQIAQTSVHRGDPGAPAINIPLPWGWYDAGNEVPVWAYGELLYKWPVDDADPPSIVFLLSRLTGNVDSAKILEYSAGELRNLPDYIQVSDPFKSQLSGYEAIQLGGVYKRDGQERLIAQKTAVIPGNDALFVLQMNADAPKGEGVILIQATEEIDAQMRIAVP